MGHANTHILNDEKNEKDYSYPGKLRAVRPGAEALERDTDKFNQEYGDRECPAAETENDGPDGPLRWRNPALNETDPRSPGDPTDD